LIVVITGVPGCGKGKVMELVGEKMDVSILNFGDFMFRMATESGLVKDRDDMRKKIGIDLTRAMQKKAAEAIGVEIEKLGENVIIDTHCTIKSPAGYFPGLPFEVLQSLRPDAIVIREVDPESIVERRNKDRATGVRSKRDEEEAGAIQLHQDLNRAYAAAYSSITGSTLKILPDKKIEEYEYQNAEVAARAVLDVFGFK
jgi:adenylate kinase